MTKMQILVTGGCGFIGSHFIRHFLETRPTASVINVDALTYAAHPDTGSLLEASFPDRYKFIRADIASPDMGTILKNADVDSIVNFAAESHVDRSILDPASFVQTNVVGLQNLLIWARKVGNPRFLHVSTDEVYGSLEPNDAPFTESSPLDPNSPYAASKASADLLALASQRTYKQEIVITRCSNNYGPFQFPEKLIPLVIANAVEDKSIPVYGDGKQVRDWIYVEDHCSAIATVLEKGRVGEIYNASAHEERHNIDLVREILNLLGKPESLITYVGDRPAHDRRYALSSAKLRNELGWAPKVSYREGLARTAEWYLQNTDWWKKVRDKEYFSFYQANYNSKFNEGEHP